MGHGVQGVPGVHGRVHEPAARVHGGVRRRKVRGEPRRGADQVRPRPESSCPATP